MEDKSSGVRTCVGVGRLHRTEGIILRLGYAQSKSELVGGKDT